MGETAHGSMKGYAPIVKVQSGNPEALKYGKMWEREEYRRVAPGEDLADLFLNLAQPKPGSDVIDFGCGTGRGGAALLERGKMRVTLVDFVRNCLDQKVQDLITARPDDFRFVKHDLETTLLMGVEFGYCTDVMEHIPEARVPVVLTNILASARHVFFSISTDEDRCGTLIGERLHLTTQKYGWWLEQFSRLKCVVHWSQDLGSSVLFYVSAWVDAQKVVDTGTPNTDDEQVKKNVAANIRGGWGQVRPYKEGKRESDQENSETAEVMIVGGGPTLAEFEDDIRAKRAAGMPMITLNGAYNWAVERGIMPSATVVVDARPFNARFTKPVIGGCKYLIASQCDPSVFEGLPKDRTYIWHTSNPAIQSVLREVYSLWWNIQGGSTVLLRAIPLLRVLGFSRFHLYGCDSCVMGGIDGPQHAYAQPENDIEGGVHPVDCGGRTFWCKTWMVSQAQEFISLIGALGDHFELEVYGDGLLKHILVTGAEIEEEKSVVESAT
jgi:SAM-dependent methyltransferase